MLTSKEIDAAIEAVDNWPEGVPGEYYFSDQEEPQETEKALKLLRAGSCLLEHG